MLKSKLAGLTSFIFGAPLVQHQFSGPTLSTAQAAMSTASSASPSTAKAYFANGCFWGTEHIFRKHFPVSRGLLDAKVGYIGGTSTDPSYREVCTGATGHAEGVELVFDPSKVTYAELVEFFYRTHDASQINQQGHDRGTQYRSAIFTTTNEQALVARKVTEDVQKAHYDSIGKTIATQIQPASIWYDAEDYHQKYLIKNPGGYECANHRLWW